MSMVLGGMSGMMVGFFSSEVLASLAPGLATYVAGSENSFRLVVSPLLRAEDQAAIEKGLKSAEEIADRILEELIVTEDLLQRYTLKCLTWLLREKRIEIKVALMKDALFHPKVWLFERSSDVVAAHRSWPVLNQSRLQSTTTRPSISLKSARFRVTSVAS